MRNVLGEPDPALMSDAERIAFLTPQRRPILSQGEPRDLTILRAAETTEWRRLRMVMGYSYGEVASLVGIEREYYHKIEIGHTRSVAPELGRQLRTLFAEISREVGDEG